MAAVKIYRPPLCGDVGANLPREQWAELLGERRNFCREVVPGDCRMLLFFVEDGERSEWFGHGTREAYLRDGLGLDPDMVDWALAGLKRTKPDVAAKFSDMVQLGKQGAPAGNNNAAKVRDENKGANRTFVRGTTTDYTLARLDRDNPELAAEVRAGNLTANAAAIQAGFRRRMVSLPAEPEAMADVIVRRYPDAAKLIAGRA